MVLDDCPFAGELTSRVEFLENTATVSATGVPNVEELTSLGRYAVQRVDGAPKTDEDGRLADVAIVTFKMRFVSSLVAKGGALIVRDFDGDYQVRGPFQILGGRKRYVQINAVRRA